MQTFASSAPNPIAGGPRPGAPARAAAGADPASADFENFLKLLTAQLRNQDPLSPLDSTQFVAQLASFSTVEQLVGANARLDALAAAVGAGGLDSFASLLGKEAEAEGAPMWLGNGPAQFRIVANSDADAAEAIIANSSGGEVARISVGNTNERQVWNGSTPSGVAPPGSYTVEVVYWRDGVEIGRRAASGFGVVEEVRNGPGGALLYTADGPFAYAADIAGIRR